MTVLRRVQQGYTYAGDLDLTVMTCPICGVTYAIPERLQENAWRRGHGRIQWYCPNGHQLGYHGESDAERERDRRITAERRAEAERDLREHTEYQLRAQKGATTKARKRHAAGHAAGLCPVCKRSFSQLQRHMQSKHPDFDPSR